MQQTGNKILGFLAILFIFVVIFSVVGVCLYTSNIKAVSKESKEVVFEVKENQVEIYEEFLIVMDLVK